MHDHHGPHHFAGWVFGAVSATGLAAKLAENGWTPQACTAFLAAMTTTIMALVQLLKAAYPYVESASAWLKARHDADPQPSPSQAIPEA